MKNRYFITCLVYMLPVLTCKGEELNVGNSGIKKSTNPQIIDQSNSPRIALIIRIDKVIQQAVKEGWSKAKWVKDFGLPRRDSKYKDDYEFIEYYESGPFEHLGKEIITGITIKLKNDRTFGYSYRRTTFDLPDHSKFEEGK